MITRRHLATCGRGILVVLALAALSTAQSAEAQQAEMTAQAQRSSAHAGRCDVTAFIEVPDLQSSAAEFVRLAELVDQAPLNARLLRRPSNEPEAVLCNRPEVPWRDRLRPAVPAWSVPDALAPLMLHPRPVRLTSHLNTAYPVERNNGALWSGRGLSTALSGGVRVRVGRLSAAFEPIVTYQENRAFRTHPSLVPGHFGEIYHGHPARLDRPQRFGSDYYWNAYFGQSYVRVDIDPIATGISTENLWWGPAMKNPILLSNTAAGFPHAFVRTSRPVDLWGVAELEAEAIWGQLQESAHFDGDASNDRRSMAGIALVVTPERIEGLWLGAARVRVSSIPPEGRAWFDYLLEPVRRGAAPTGTEPLQISTLFARWVLRDSDLEVYGEAALPDAAWTAATEGGETDTDRALGWVIGGQKVFTVGEGWIRVSMELTQLQNEIDLQSGLPTASYYVHPEVAQGYSHRGQLLGAAVGPGSESQIVGADLYRSWGSVGIFVERIGYDDDAFYARYAPVFGMHGHDVEVALGLRQTLHRWGMDASWSLRFAHRRNRDFIPLPEGFWAERNATLVLDLSWVPSL